MLRTAKFVLGFFLSCGFLTTAKAFEPLIYLRPNEAPMFTELYQRYGLLNPPMLHVYDSSVYLGQPGEKGLLIPSSEAFFSNVEESLRDYHKRLNNLDLFIDPKETKYVFSPSNGSLQTIFALVYAIVSSEPQKKFLFVEKIPFYSFHEHAISYKQYTNARFQGFYDPKEIKLNPDETLVEFVTSPNNPDGTFREPYTDAKIIIADFVFASPSYGEGGTGYIQENMAWVTKARGEGKHIYAFNSVSKALGKPGFRLGYMWFPMGDAYSASILPNYFAYIWKLTVGGSTPGAGDALDLMSALAALPDAGQALRNDAYHTIAKRHEVVEAEIQKRYPGSTVVSIPGSPTFFAKINSEQTKEMTAEQLLFKTYNVAVDNGNAMGATDAFIRINLCGYSGDLAEFLNRLSGENKYKGDDLLLTKANYCAKTIVHSNENPSYVVNPNDCKIEVDAAAADVTITLPEMINFQKSNLLTFKRLDNSQHTVTVLGRDFRVVVNDDLVKAQWTQPFFRNGQWMKVVS